MKKTKKTHARWTDLDVHILREEVKKHPYNLRYAFFLTSQQTKHTPKGVEKKYYKDIRQDHKESKGILFRLFSKFGKFVNTKNVSQNKIINNGNK